jgi:signal transduction histidine kinase
MSSERRLKRVALCAAALVAACAFGTGATQASPALRGASVAGALAGFIVLWRSIGALSSAAHPPPVEIPVGLPHDHAALAARVLELETILEHAPIALFAIAGADEVAPLNINARRQLAPGRACDAGELFGKLAAVVPGRRTMLDFGTERGVERAVAMSVALAVEGIPRRIAALMPVENELEAEAMHAWQKLVHVLTHEIMNSLTPVASLSQTSRELLEAVRNAVPDDAARETVHETVREVDVALDAINRRAGSLTQFVTGYRSLASVPAAQPQAVSVTALFARLSAMVAPAWQTRGGRAEFSVEPASVELMADPGQLEQALINLLKNADEATAGIAAPAVVVTARLGRGGRLRIEVRDNGPGVPDDVIPHIFTPFFSTKEKGSGIGLAMVRQLVHRNGGTVRYAKTVGAGACFIVAF